METCISYTDETAYVSTDERKTINRLRKLAAEYPDQVRVMAEPENNDGCLYTAIPSKWVRISPPKKMELTDEQRAAMAERMLKARIVIETERMMEDESEND